MNANEKVKEHAMRVEERKQNRSKHLAVMAEDFTDFGPMKDRVRIILKEAELVEFFNQGFSATEKINAFEAMNALKALGYTVTRFLEQTPKKFLCFSWVKEGPGYLIDINAFSK